VRRYFVLAPLTMASLTGCAKKDTVLDFGGGDSIRLSGAGDVFDCDDPKYAKVKKDEVYDVHSQPCRVGPA
jgi:hypothetical protein